MTQRKPSSPMVLILDGNLTYNMMGTHVGKKDIWRKISDCSRSNKMPWTDQIIEFDPCVRTCLLFDK